MMLVLTTHQQRDTSLQYSFFISLPYSGGIANTPQTVVSTVQGKDWDPLQKKWVKYDLKEEAKRVLSMSQGMTVNWLASLLLLLGPPPLMYTSCLPLVLVFSRKQELLLEKAGNRDNRSKEASQRHGIL